MTRKEFLAADLRYKRAFRQYVPIRDAYRAGRISDAQYIAARRVMDAADKAWDEAYAEAQRSDFGCLTDDVLPSGSLGRNSPKSGAAMNKPSIVEEAFNRAVSSASLTNYPSIFRGFMERGIPESDIKPRENVFTYHAWRALGRFVRKGEKGVAVVTFREYDKKDEKTGEVSHRRSPWHTTVFHISQTDPMRADAPGYRTLAP